VDAVVALAISTAGTLGGGALGGWIGLHGARSLSADEREAAARAETLRSFRLYFGCVATTVARHREVPFVPEPTQLSKAVERVTEWVTDVRHRYIAVQRRAREAFGDSYRDLSGRLAETLIDLQLRELPATVRAATDASSTYVQRLGEQRSPELVAQWPDVHAQLTAAGEELRVWADALRGSRRLRLRRTR
jgi:hypothetical protein